MWTSGAQQAEIVPRLMRIIAFSHVQELSSLMAELSDVDLWDTTS
jgi:hypothetical protein